MLIQFKRLIYGTLQILLKSLWHLSGGRRKKAMGLSLNLHPNTEWSGRRGLKLPIKDCRSNMVTFVDFVQVHAVCNLINTLPHNPVIVDVGAHHGEYAILLGGLIKACAGGVLIAIEPDITNMTILKSNIERNDLQDIVQVVESAISDSTSVMDFVSNGLEGHLFVGGNTGQCVSYKVKVETLRDIIARFKLDKIDLLLIDVEGAELSVLRGFPWETMRPAMIFCELHPYNWPIFNYSGQDMVNFLEKHQYRCFDMYLHEHKSFNTPYYIGPCFFLPGGGLSDGDTQLK